MVLHGCHPPGRNALPPNCPQHVAAIPAAAAAAAAAIIIIPL